MWSSHGLASGTQFTERGSELRYRVLLFWQHSRQFSVTLSHTTQATLATSCYKNLQLHQCFDGTQCFHHIPKLHFTWSVKTCNCMVHTAFLASQTMHTHGIILQAKMPWTATVNILADITNFHLKCLHREIFGALGLTCDIKKNGLDKQKDFLKMDHLITSCIVYVCDLLAPSKASWPPNWLGSPIINVEDIIDGWNPTDGGAKSPLLCDGMPWNGFGTLLASSPGNEGRMVEKYDAGTAAGVKSGNDDEDGAAAAADDIGRCGVKRSAELQSQNITHINHKLSRY